jgi:transcription-repair coupling factor (superfamily II helicase)
MNVSGLLELLRQVESYQALTRSLSGGSWDGESLNLPRYARPAVIASLHHDLGQPVVVIVPRVDQAQKLTQELSAWSPTPEAIHRFPEPTPLPYDRAPWGERSRNGRLAVLAMLQSIDSPFARETRPSIAPLVISSVRALAQKTLPPRDFLTHTRRLKVGQAVQLSRLLEAWLNSGYRPATVVEEPGAFSRRGGILDICPPGSQTGVRIELFGDQIESLRGFDLTTQRTLSTLDVVLAPPACEALPIHGPRIAARLADTPADSEWREDVQKMEEGICFPGSEFYLPYMYQQPASLLDYLPPGTLLFVDDRVSVQEELADIERRANQLRDERRAAGGPDALPSDYPSPVFEWRDMSASLGEKGAVALGGLASSDPDSESQGGVGDRGPARGEQPGRRAADLSTAFSPGPRYGGQIKPLMDHLVRLYLNGQRAVIVSRQAARLAELWQEHGPARGPQNGLSTPPPDGSLSFVQGVLGDGFTLQGRISDDRRASTLVATKPRTLLHLLTDAEIFGWSRPEPRQAPRTRAIAPETYFGDITHGDLVVHIDHGIGRFGGLITKQIGGLAREYLLVTYAQDDQLYVPVHQADRLSRYIGAGEHQPALHRLGGASWAQTKAQAKKEVDDIADDLLALYAARASVQGHAFSPDSAWQAELEASFPYLETEDQLGAINQVKRDMERPRPMDRLVCGDVGYGKTEVALRAAFKAVMDGKQVGVLVPTTVLAQQHFNTFLQRLAAFPVEVRMLSRFRSRAEQSEILTELAAGKADITIGTHRLLQKDVTFKDLGLLIVDEEQRFGVAHKEMLKQLRTEVDVLTMTATPIPRTLYMSLSGVRDISLISTPPEERLPVQTHVGVYDPRMVRRAVLRELDRGGQVFLVHNRVQTIRSVAYQLASLIPEARIAVGHGQMSERELEQVMLSFVAGDVDVLVSTSIIENGLDIPNANTIIVDRADWFGLAQLYQLRGRVGRGARRAYAFFFYRSAADLTSEARARLETIAEHTELGAGYSIAMRDLEIRGAGEILGTQQHGHIAAVGFDLFTRLLARAVQQRRGEREPHAEPEATKEALAPLPDIVAIELPLDSFIPPDYVADSQLRFRLYRRLAGLTTLKAIDDMASELVDRFGPFPDEVDNLLYQLRVKVLASRAGALSIMTADTQISIRIEGLEMADRPALQRYLGDGVRVSRQAIWLAWGDGRPQDWRVSLVQALERLTDWARRHKQTGDGG